MTEEARIRARGDEERAVRGLGVALERKRPEDLLDPLELPVLEEPAQKLDVGLSGAWAGETRDVDGWDALQADCLHVSKIRERNEPARKSEGRCGLAVRNGRREIVTQTSQVIERCADGQVSSFLDSMIHANPGLESRRFGSGVIVDDLSIGSLHVLLRCGGKRPGFRVNAGPCQRAVLQAGIVQD